MVAVVVCQHFGYERAVGALGVNVHRSFGHKRLAGGCGSGHRDTSSGSGVTHGAAPLGVMLRCHAGRAARSNGGAHVLCLGADVVLRLVAAAAAAAAESARGSGRQRELTACAPYRVEVGRIEAHHRVEIERADGQLHARDAKVGVKDEIDDDADAVVGVEEGGRERLQRHLQAHVHVERRDQAQTGRRQQREERVVGYAGDEQPDADDDDDGVVRLLHLVVLGALCRVILDGDGHGHHLLAGRAAASADAAAAAATSVLGAHLVVVAAYEEAEEQVEHEYDEGGQDVQHERYDEAVVDDVEHVQLALLARVATATAAGCVRGGGVVGHCRVEHVRRVAVRGQTRGGVLVVLAVGSGCAGGCLGRRGSRVVAVVVVVVVVADVARIEEHLVHTRRLVVLQVDDQRRRGRRRLENVGRRRRSGGGGDAQCVVTGAERALIEHELGQLGDEQQRVDDGDEPLGVLMRDKGAYLDGLDDGVEAIDGEYERDVDAEGVHRAEHEVGEEACETAHVVQRSIRIHVHDDVVGEDDEAKCEIVERQHEQVEVELAREQALLHEHAYGEQVAEDAEEHGGQIGLGHDRVQSVVRGARLDVAIVAAAAAAAAAALGGGEQTSRMLGHV